MKKLTKRQQEVLLTKNGELRKKFRNTITKISSTTIHHSKWTSSGGYYNLQCFRTELTLLLNTLKFKFTNGNDAPKGGLNGNFIKISKIAMCRINEINNNY